MHQLRLTFQLRFHTRPGQSLWLTGNHDILGQGRAEQAIPLQYLNEQFWQVTLVFPEGTAPDAAISYSYLLRNGDGSVAQDWGQGRLFNPAAFQAEEVLLIDSWNHPGYYENAFYTEPFKEVLLKANHTEVQTADPVAVTHIFKVKAPLLAKGQTLCLLGDAPELGHWNTAAPLLMCRRAGEDFFVAPMDLGKASFPFVYKYGVYDVERHTFVRYEDGPNRNLYDTAAPHKQTIVNDGFALLPSTTWKGAGIAIPVFSLRSEAGFGVGEYTDLKRLTDWCRQTGLKLIQLLPINDTTATHTWTDSYPYSAISAFALHPLYLNLERVAGSRHKGRLQELEAERKRLNALKTLDYEAVMKSKLAFIKQIYPLERDRTFRSLDYRRFFEQNKSWLAPYAAFCHLRDRYGTPDFNQWPAYRRYRAEEIAALAAPGASPSSPAHENGVTGTGEGAGAPGDDIGLHYFIQYHLHLQLQEAAEYAHANGIILKGDIAIGVYRYGADVWQQPELYHLEVQAGAPPDAFAAKGQNWSFPTYNWPRMKEDGYAWWKQRFEQMGRYFDAFRIDHILGFFRIWSIPLDALEGILGYFVPAIPVQIDEFSRRGIAFDRDRYLRPYITEPVLGELFGPEVEGVKAQFLQADRLGNWALKAEFATQRQVEHYFASLEKTERNRRLQQGLFDLISNVLLFEVEGSQGQQYHFRFGIEETASFRALDAETQSRLRDLYIDYFFRRQDAFWMRKGMEKLPALKWATRMLVCGEDLGMVPHCVPEAMKQLGLLSLEVQRMPKRLGQEFSYPQAAPYLSVVTPSTHDMSTIRGWWREERDRTQRFYNRVLSQPGQAPEECEAWINQAIIVQHLASPAMWSVFQLQDLLGMDEQLRWPNPDEERINVPANPRNYWRYRMHLTLEELLQAQAFNDKLRTLVHQNGR